ncbi:hypothetical protein COP1_002989 [Malus domestica]
MTKNARMEAYRQLVKGLMNGFKYFELKQIPREMNEIADQLACAASTAQENLRVAEVEYMHSSSIEAVQSDMMQIGGQRLRFDNPLPEQAQAEDNDCWMTPIVNYLTKGIQPEDLVEARKLQMKAVRYAIFSDTLYRRSFSGPYLRCLNPRQSEWVLRELHEGMCGNHSGGRSLAHRALTQGYFWPYMARDAE